MSDLFYVYMMRSRNKDNKNIEGFKERAKVILAYDNDKEYNKVMKIYFNFVKEGLPGEKTRLYRSVNARDEQKVREDLIVRLLKDKPSLTNMNNILASVAQQVHNRAESKWLFDFDEDNEMVFNEFYRDITNCFSDFFDRINIQWVKTPNGYAVVVPHGFDTRDLMRKWINYDITLKKDELLFLGIEENN